MHKLKYGVVALACLTACEQTVRSKEVLINNTLDLDRTEVVAINLADLPTRDPDQVWQVLDGANEVLSQLVDVDEDSVDDQLIFLADIKANAEKRFTIQITEEVDTVKHRIRTYSRFVPERTDDYAWENDLVAFRTYGPEAQRMVEAGEKGGTLSSGMDCWLKRVEYPIIDRWYKKYTDGGSYHQDDGEGYDPYHVGASRGCGGIGVWIDDSLFVSKNFTSYRKVAEGPVRTIFELTYAPWIAGDASISETKRITIDLGKQLYKVENKIHTSNSIPNVAIGITMHDGMGTAFTDSLKGFFSYWESIDDSELGTGVVIAPDRIKDYHENRTKKKDLSQLYIFAKPDETVTYYTGFAWKKAGKIQTLHHWNMYLEQFAKRLQHPLEVRMK